MARPGITYYHVSKAAAELAASGKNPTVDNVREALGNTGSRGTIGPLLKRWKTEHQETAAWHAAGIPEELLQVVRSLYERLQADAQGQLEAASVAHAQAQADLEAARLAVEQHAAVLATQLRTSEARLLEEQDAHNRCRSAVTDAEKRELILTTEITSLSQRLQDRDCEAERLHGQLAHARTQFEHYQQATASQRAEERRQVEAQRVACEQELAVLRRERQELLVARAQDERELAHGREQNQHLSKALAELEAEQAITTHRAAELSQECHRLSGLEHALQQRLSIQQASMEKLQEHVRDTEAQRLVLADRLSRVEQELERLRHAHLRLVHEKAALEGRLSALQVTPATLVPSISPQGT